MTMLTREVPARNGERDGTRYTYSWEGWIADTDLRGKVCLVTGASSGIGKAAARGLALLGARVGLICRDRKRGEKARGEIVKRTGNDAIDLFVGDFSSQADVRRIAAEIRERYDRVDVLVNNAGGVFGRRKLTEDGIEWTLAVNHLAAFLLTNLILDLLQRSPDGRIINVSSTAHHLGSLDFDDLQLERFYFDFVAYCQSKLANVSFTTALARRLHGTTVTVNSVHPGIVRSKFGFSGSLWIQLSYLFGRLFLRSSDGGADTILYLAASPEVAGVSGKYFADRRPATASAAGTDPEIAERLWEESAKLTHLERPSQPSTAAGSRVSCAERRTERSRSACRSVLLRPHGPGPRGKRGFDRLSQRGILEQ
jgi:NAD(P)-dependent dehydrogenase (short-subunit alcohol dehydrogenase family)